MSVPRRYYLPATGLAASKKGMSLHEVMGLEVATDADKLDLRIIAVSCYINKAGCYYV
jgi:hypothetical protein